MVRRVILGKLLKASVVWVARGVDNKRAISLHRLTLFSTMQ